MCWQFIHFEVTGLSEKIMIGVFTSYTTFSREPQTSAIADTLRATYYTYQGVLRSAALVAALVTLKVISSFVWCSLCCSCPRRGRADDRGLTTVLFSHSPLIIYHPMFDHFQVRRLGRPLGPRVSWTAGRQRFSDMRSPLSSLTMPVRFVSGP